jgi:hypothetical protein
VSRPVTTTNEFGKVLQAAGAPEGPSPGWAELRAGWRSRRPPAALVVAAVLGALTPLALVAVAVLVVVRAVTSDASLFPRVVVPVLLVGILLGLAALCLRGELRALHLGDTRGLRFPARVAGIVCVPVAGFLVFWTQVRENPVEASMAAPFAFLALTLLPVPLLAVPAVRRWPTEVLLRRGPAVRSGWEVWAFLQARPHPCGQVLALPPGGAEPVADAERTGSVLRGSCPRCGQPYVYTFADAPPRDRAAPGDPLALGARASRGSGLGGGDWQHLATTLAVPDALDVATAGTATLETALAHGAVSVQATGELLALVPPRRRAVPIRRLSGHPLPLAQGTRELTRTVLQRRAGERRARVEQVHAELVRRGAAPPDLPW